MATLTFTLILLCSRAGAALLETKGIETNTIDHCAYGKEIVRSGSRSGLTELIDSSCKLGLKESRIALPNHRGGGGAKLAGWGWGLGARARWANV